jgi:hypothetical protein
MLLEQPDVVAVTSLFLAGSSNFRDTWLELRASLEWLAQRGIPFRDPALPIASPV